VVGSVVHLGVPREVNRPGVWDPLSHLIVILDWGWWASWLSDPVENLVIVLRVVDTLWPWSSPGVSVHVDWDTGGFGLEVHDIIKLILVGVGGDTGKGNSDKGVFHFFTKIIYYIIQTSS
jgi:hypothetical protein